ncbi:site-specific integrase [Mariniblastus sp.]|nr:site-specific integrase [Mariniblastus sp.]
MPSKITPRIPTYRLHKASGQAVVTINGRDHYLGKWNTASGKAKYDRVIAEFLANGRQLRNEDEKTVEYVINAYLAFAQHYYRKNEMVTREFGCIREALKIVKHLYGPVTANKFGPLALKAVRQCMIDKGWSRGYINKSIGRVRRCIKWAVENELVRSDLFHGLMAVSGLRKGRSDAREPAPVLPVDRIVVETTLSHLLPVVADMVHFQGFTGCRPQDVCNLRFRDVDMSDSIWLYRPETHKTEHLSRLRVIPIGPRCQDVLRPYLISNREIFCFRPVDAVNWRREERHKSRKTKLSYGNAPRTNRKRNPQRTAGEKYTTSSYRRAIHRACDAAFPIPSAFSKLAGESMRGWQERLSDDERVKVRNWQSSNRWSPNQLRHSVGTEIRKRFGLEAAQVILGHASADVTQVYAERDLSKAIEIMQEVG